MYNTKKQIMNWLHQVSVNDSMSKPYSMSNRLSLQSHFLSVGVPSVPIITDVTAGILQFTIKVYLYGGHTSLNFNVSIISEQNAVTYIPVTQTNISSGLMYYTINIGVAFYKPGRYRFAVSASNLFGKSAMKSDVYPPADINGLEGNTNYSESYGIIFNY